MSQFLWAVGIILIICKVAGVVPFGMMSWWIILLPFYPMIWGFIVVSFMALTAMAVGLLALIVSLLE